MPNLHASWLSRLSQHWDTAAQSLPSQCAICKRWPGLRFCSDCRARWVQPVHRCSLCACRLPELASVCGACLKRPPKLSRCIAVLDYAYPWRDVIADYKFRADTGLARSLGQLLSSNPQAQELLEKVDVLLPVPPSPQRLRERGFDHTLLLARALSRNLATSKIWHKAVSHQHTQLAQHELGRAQRLRQLRGAFKLMPAYAEKAQGLQFLLLDDVMTTGATLDAVADCLLRAGAASVSGLVLARTPE